MVHTSGRREDGSSFNAFRTLNDRGPKFVSSDYAAATCKTLNGATVKLSSALLIASSISLISCLAVARVCKQQSAEKHGVDSLYVPSMRKFRGDSLIKLRSL
jgi:hypothetical protein